MALNPVYALDTTTAYAPVRVFATVNQIGNYVNGPLNNGINATFTYATPGPLVIDGVAINVNDSVLLNVQNAPYENGIYYCSDNGVGGTNAVLTRRGDMQCVEQIKSGYPIQSQAGATYAGGYAAIVEPLPQGIGKPLVPDANDINFSASITPAPNQFLERLANLSDVADPIASLNNLAGLAVYGTNLPTTEIAYPGIAKEITVDFSELNSGGKVILNNNASSTYVIVNLIAQSDSINFDLAGDRDVVITDGTNIFSQANPAALQNLAGTNNYILNTTFPLGRPSAAGQPIVCEYSGGTTDYTAGTLKISLIAFYIQ